jgi:hypothetical protein
MSPPNAKRQREAWNTIDQLFAQVNNCWIVHYSCESFYERPEGTSPRITSIAVRNLDTAQTQSFSIHQVAERKHIALNQIPNHYDELERFMLEEYFEHLRQHQGMNYLHWNMRDINYGFAAIEHRFKVLGGEPFVVGDNRKYDVARLLIDIYGSGYAPHPRLQRLLAINGIKPLNFKSGKEEAAAFENRQYVELHQSTLRKVNVIADILYRVHSRTLKTRTTWCIAFVIATASLALTIYGLR